MAHSRSRDEEDPGPEERRQPPGVAVKRKKIKIGDDRIVIKVYNWRGTNRKQRKEIFAKCGLIPV